jgi:heme-degrading monooxygenase HmoA
LFDNVPLKFLSVHFIVAAAFEKRWANRKSRLATLPGFKYFHLMRRVTLDAEAAVQPDDFGYVSLTVWETKKDFNVWRQGDAFKEAHGGTSITDFLSTMINSAFLLKGAPKPAFFDGLCFQSTVPTSLPETVNGWRVVEADGTHFVDQLPKRILEGSWTTFGWR